jgi:transposase-like protein
MKQDKKTRPTDVETPRSKPARRGRPSVLDETKKQIVCALIAAGASRTAAARHVGCSRHQLYYAAQRDAIFQAQLEKAEADFEVVLVARIGEAARSKTQWRAAAWLLERRNPDQFRLRNPKLITPAELQIAISQVVEVLTESLEESKQAEILQRVGEVLGEFRDDESEAADQGEEGLDAAEGK